MSLVAMVVSVAMAGDSGKGLIEEGVFVADLDCSGALDQVVQSTTPDGDTVLEVAFDLPKDQLREPSGFSKDGAAVEIADTDKDGCDDLIATVDREVYAFPSGDSAWLDSGKHVKGEEGDVTVLFRRGGGRVSMFPGRFGTLGDCAPVCESWQYVVYPCASNQDGTVTFCDAWVCAKWVETCLPA